jgi:hypothetical protein
VNDTLAADKVFRYTAAGTLEGSWTLSTTNPSPTGITIDPNDVNHIWVVDASTDKVYQYNNATTQLTGSQQPGATFSLAATNTNPQGIADPLSTGPGFAASHEILVTPARAMPVTSSVSSILASQKSDRTSSVHGEPIGPMIKSSGESATPTRSALSAKPGREPRSSRRQETSLSWSQLKLNEDGSNNSPILKELDDLFSDVALLMQ